MAQNYIQPGDVIEVTLAEPASSGQAIVLGDTLGVALGDIAGGAPGSVAIAGVFTLPKVAAATFPVGSKLLWDTSESAFNSAETVPDPGDLLGCALATEAGTNGATTINARLIPGNTGPL